MSQEIRLVEDYLCGQFRINAIQDVLEGIELSQEEQEAVEQLKTWLNDDLNAKRNKVMGQRVVDLLTAGSGTSQFFALGLGHFLAGKQTIVEEVREAGFMVERVMEEDDLRRWRQSDSGAERAALSINILCFLVLILSSNRIN